MSDPGADRPILTVDALHVRFPAPGGDVHAVRGVSFEIRSGEILAIVGESGSGKTLTALALVGLARGAQVEGAVGWNGRDLLRLAPAELHRVRGNEIGYVFQDPVAALDPVQRVGRQVGEVLALHRGATPREAHRRAVDLLALVGVTEPERVARSYPHELSGGMCQRAMIAMAIACEPALLIADEPTTALDVTVQAQVLDVLLSMRERIGSAVLLITHDVGVVAAVADRVAVMYAGRIVEIGTVDEILTDPRHPYTRALLAAVPRLDEARRDHLTAIPGTPPAPVEEVPGCPFHPRCGLAQVPEPCASERPLLRGFEGGGARACACHFADRALPVESGR